ncbi:MAG: T9SS type A sorting domain-containing protein [Bacteroidota bacterium]
MIKKLLFLVTSVLIFGGVVAQTTLTDAVDFNVKTVYGVPISLFPLLDDENQIVVIDFFSTTCGPCHDYAPDFQACYEKFGHNEGNVYFLGINWGNDNQGVIEFDSIHGLTFPTSSGSQGGGNIVYGVYEILSYPTVILITPDHTIVEQYIWYPSEENITNAVIAAGGIMVGTEEVLNNNNEINIFPNPVKAKGTIEFELNSSVNVYLTIYNLLGRQVYSEEVMDLQKGINQIVFPVDELDNGLYFVKIESDKENIGTKRISVLN